MEQNSLSAPDERISKQWGLGFILAGLLINAVAFFPAVPENLFFLLTMVDIGLVAIGILIIRMRGKLKRLRDLGIGFFITILTLLLLEGSFYLLLRLRGQDKVRYEEQTYHIGDSQLGYKLAPNVEIVSSKIVNDKIIYTATYSIDEWGRRITPTHDPSIREKHLIFFGDSFTFGIGVENDQTLPYEVTDQATAYQAYNYGASGYGPQMMFALLESGALRTQIAQQEGVAVYTFLDPHIPRTVGSMQVFNEWGRYTPYYFLDEDGSLVRNGNFVTGRPFVSALYIILGQSSVIKFFNLDFPRIQENHIRLVAKLIEASRDLYREQFGNQNFYVLVYPGFSSYAPRLIPYLETAGVKYLDYSKLFEFSQEEFWIAQDYHPTPKAFQTIAPLLIHDLQLEK